MILIGNSLHYHAFRYRISRAYYDINKTESVVLQEEREEYKIVSDFLPQTDECPSSILSLKQFYRLWMMLPEHCQVRIPTLIYSSYNDGFLLSSLYTKWNQHKQKMLVKCMFLIIKTLDGDIFGVYLDTVITKTIKSYIGSTDTFLFGFYSEKRVQYFSQKLNEQYWIGGEDYLQIGGGGDGPAIRLNGTLQEGQTNAWETFGSPKLTSSEDDFFAVKSIEVIMI